MDKETKPEKEFSGNLDEMLAGQKVEMDSAQPDDYRAILSFAQKLIELRDTPRPSFEAKLKASLLSRLKESERETKPSSFWKGWQNMILNSLNRPIWRAVTPVVLVAILAVGVLWGTGVLSRLIGGEVPAPSPVPAPVPAPTPGPHPTPAPHRPPLAVGGTPAKTTYLPRETVTVEFTFTNVSTDDPITLKNFPPGIVVSDASFEMVWSSSPSSAQRSLKPGEAAKYSLSWDQRDASGTQVAPGFYYLGPEEVQFESALLGNVRIGVIGVARVLILPAQGAMEKSLEPNQSVTAGGISITLKQVELSSLGTRIVAFTPLPGYKLAEGGGPPLPPPPFMVHAVAEYSYDGAPARKAGSAGNRFLETGIELIWENLSPIPSDAEVLIFTVTRFGEQAGPWEFQIPLK